MKLIFRYLIIVAMLQLLLACGFQLRGVASQSQVMAVAQSPVQIELLSESPYGEFEKVVRQSLSKAGFIIQSAETASSATSIQLELAQIKMTEQGGIRDSFGRASEMILRAQLDYRLLHETDLEPQQNLSAEQQQLVDAQQIVRQLSASESYYQDYRNPINQRNQRLETEKIIHQKLARRLLDQLYQFIQQVDSNHL
ncbi:hypothetical protein [Aliikangiella maris]|uniref:Uncharacterized protein n=2 Tax=Aliikangiella maris TaxID=3162458 RepID=A0ABV2BY14_9GAMM